MPNMADITVKKSDGTTDVVYKALTPSAGDRVAAQWRVESIGYVAANRPVLSVVAKASVNQKFRVVTAQLSYPETYTNTTTGLVMVRERCLATLTWSVPVDLTDATVGEFVAQAANLMKSTLLLDVVKSGYAPT